MSTQSGILAIGLFVATVAGIAIGMSATLGAGAPLLVLGGGVVACWVFWKWERVVWVSVALPLALVTMLPARFDALLKVTIAGFSFNFVQVSVACVLVVFTFVEICTRGFAVPAARVSTSAYLFVLVALLGSLRTPAQGMTGLILYVVPFALFLFIASLPVNEAQWRQLVRLVVWGGGVLSLWAVVFALAPFTIAPLLGWDSFSFGAPDAARIWSPIGGPIATGGFLGLVFPLALALAIDPGSRSERWISLGIVGLLVTSILLTFSRGVVIATSVAGLVFTWRLLRYSKYYKFAIGLGLCLLGLAVVLANVVDLSRLTMVTDDSVSSRAQVAEAAVRLFYENPIVGTGIGAVFPRYWSTNIMTLYGAEVLVDPHNLYLLVLSETGLFGLLGFLLQFVAIGRGLLRIASASIWRTAFLASLVFFLVHSMGSSDLVNQFRSSVGTWIVFGLAIQKARINSELGAAQGEGLYRYAVRGEV